MNHSRKNVAGLCLVCIAACSAIGLFLGTGAWASPETASGRTLTKNALPTPRLVAVKLHADWCRVCQKGAPEFEKVKKEMADKPVLFLTFDWTNDKTKRQSAYLAALLGLDRPWQNEARRVGTVLLIDPETKRALDVIDLRRNQAEINDAIDKRLTQNDA